MADNTLEERRINMVDRRSHEDRRKGAQEMQTLEVVAGGSFVEMAGGIGAVVLSILGLAGIDPILLTAIATIAIGASVLVQGLTIGEKYSKIARQVGGTKLKASEFGVGMSGEILSGIAGIVVGILALFTISPMVLLPVAAIVLGAGFFFSSGSNARLNDLHMEMSRNPMYQRVMSEMITTSAGSQMLIGLGAVVLGILALIGIAPIYLTLVAMLAIGVAALLSGSSVGGKMITLVHGRA